MRCDNWLLSRILKHLAASAEENSHNKIELWLRQPSAQSQKPHCRAGIAVAHPQHWTEGENNQNAEKLLQLVFERQRLISIQDIDLSDFKQKRFVIFYFQSVRITILYFCIMTDYSTAIIALVVVGIVFTVAVVYVLAQPSDLPANNKDK